MNLNDIVRRLKEVIVFFQGSSNDFISSPLQNQWSKNGNEQGSPADQEKVKPDLKLEFQFEKVKKLEGELAAEQQRLKVINLNRTRLEQKAGQSNQLLCIITNT